ncbi:MAG: ribonuclease Z [Ferruginibacter sp.]|nr:ribonuclease Z [Ferruginibacter sp.]
MLALTILGNNSAIPAFGRNPTAQVLQLQEEYFLIDCGEGTQLQMTKYKIRWSKINHIFISHLHGDHYFGLIGLLTSMSLLNREHDLHIYGPSPLEHIIDFQLRVADTKLSYTLHFHAITFEGLIVDENKFTVHSFQVKHRIECWGFLFKQKKKPRSIDPVSVKNFDIPSSFYERLQKGEDYITKKGAVIANETLTIANSPIKSYAYCADTIFDESLAEKVQGVDLLYHETTYLKESADKAAARFHCTTEQAGNIALKAGAKKLIIGHFSSRYELLDEFLSETMEVFENTELAMEGSCYRI